MTAFSESHVQKHLQQAGLKAVIDDAEPRLDAALPTAISSLDEYDEPEFELWRLLKERAIEKLRYNHRLALSGQFLVPV